jgi:predicted anti-sigma-YlaC factor YlaD
MDADFDGERLSKWLAGVATTEQEELDCDVLAQMLESVVAAGTSDREIRDLLPDVALHLDHCPECGEWYNALLDLWNQQG